jgi:hypothetical protein
MSDRPIIDVKLSHTDKPLAVFTHVCLRPVIKQKHTTLCAIIRNEKNLDSREMSKYSEAKNSIFLKGFMQKNIELRSTLVGVIIGCFTENELTFYLENQKETRRRMIEMTITRYLSEFNLS